MGGQMGCGASTQPPPDQPGGFPWSSIPEETETDPETKIDKLFASNLDLGKNSVAQVIVGNWVGIHEHCRVKRVYCFGTLELHENCEVEEVYILHKTEQELSTGCKVGKTFRLTMEELVDKACKDAGLKPVGSPNPVPSRLGHFLVHLHRQSMLA